MSRKEALEKLELDEFASPSQIEQSYQELYNEFQMRITNAPTEHQRKLYRKKLDELEAAYQLLSGQGSDIADHDLPQTGPGIIDPVESEPVLKKEKPSRFDATGDIVTDSLRILQIELLPDTLEALKEHYDRNVAELNDSLNSPRESIRALAEAELDDVKKAYEHLQTTIKARKYEELKKEEPPKKKSTTTKAAPKPKPSPQQRRKRKKTAMVGIAMAILLLLILVLKPWSLIVSKETRQQFELYKTEADLKFQSGDLAGALQLYLTADSVLSNRSVSELIEDIKTRIEAFDAKALPEYNKAKEANTIANYDQFLQNHPQSTYATEIAQLRAAASWFIYKSDRSNWKERPILIGTVGDEFLIAEKNALQYVHKTGELTKRYKAELGLGRKILTSDQFVMVVNPVGKEYKVNLQKRDLKGISIWEKTYTVSYNSEPKLKELASGNMVLYHNGDGGTPEMIKLDADGNILWQKEYKTSRFRRITDILELSEGHLFVAAAGDIYHINGETGKLNWRLNISDGFMNNIFPNSLLKTEEGYLVANNLGGGKAYIVGINKSFKVSWRKTIAINYQLSGLIEAQDGSGFFALTDNGLLKLDWEANVIWKQNYTFAPRMLGSFYSLFEDPLGGLLIGGRDTNMDIEDTFLKTDKAGFVDQNIKPVEF